MGKTCCAMFLVCCCVSAAWAPVLGQGLEPAGDEFQVNALTTGIQWRPAAASLGDGRFAVAWESEASSGDDASGRSIQARCFAADGMPLGPEAQVNAYTDGNQGDVSIATLSDGRLAFAWSSSGSNGTDSSYLSIQSRRFAADCTPLGEQIQVNTFTPGTQAAPRVAALPGGGFVIVWESDGSFGTDSSGGSIQGRRLDAGGAPMEGEFQVNSYTSGSQQMPSVAALADGGFVVVWASWGSSGSDSSATSIQGRRFAAGGLPLAPDFQVNSFTQGAQTYPAVTGLADGGFVVAWDDSAGTAGTGKSLQGRRYAADGTAAEQFQVNSYTADSQLGATLTGLASGGFVAAWHSRGASGPDSSRSSVQARRFTASGHPLEEDLQVNAYTTGHQLRSTITELGGGEVKVAWVSEGSSGTDSSSWSIQGRRLAAVPRHALVGLGGKCLDVAGAVPADGTAVNIYRCHGGDNQRWQLQPTGAVQRIVGLGGKCLIPDFDHPSGDLRMVIGECGGPQDLFFFADPGSSVPSTLVHFQTGLCLDVEGAVASDGTPTQLFGCHGEGNQTWRPAPELCARDADGLCLERERFRIDLAWRSFDGTSGSGKAVPIGTDESGLLWFFEAENWEMLIKVLDGCHINDRFWVFAAATTTVEYTLTVTDTAVGAIAEYFNALGNAADAITDTDAFATCSAAAAATGLPRAEWAAPIRRISPASAGGDVSPAGLKGSCFPTATSLCLSNNRFQVEAEWRDPAGITGSARTVPIGSEDSGMLWFFDSGNWEMLVKVLDACHLPDARFLMLAAATTNVEYTLRVTDTFADDSREYFNPQGNPSAALVDEFRTCP